MRRIDLSAFMLISNSLFAQINNHQIYHKVINHNLASDTVPIRQKQQSILLKEVTVRAIPDFRLDSIKTRKEYSSVFNYKSPGFKDIFIPISFNKNTPVFPNIATNNTSTLISLNLLQVVGLITQSKAPVSKLQKKLLKDEENNYVDEMFSKQKVTAETGLKGDSLQNFMDRYRPSIIEIKRMTSYELMVYIKKSYAEFIKPYNNEKSSPFNE